MTTKQIRESTITRPEPAALTSSVLDHFPAETLVGFGWRNNEGLWPSYNCLDLITPTPMCPEPMATGAKIFTSAGWVPAFEFAVYGGTQCKALGLDKEDQLAETKRVFERSAGKGIEQALMLNRFVATDSDAAISWDAPVDLGAAPNVQAAIAKMEGYAAATYAGIPTLHMPLAAVVMAFSVGLLENRGGKFFTKTGAKVVAGGGYDDPTPPQSGTMDMWVTGEIFIEQSEDIAMQAWVVPGDGSGIGSDENGLASNTVVSLAERMYRVAVDCLVAKVTATVWA